MAGWWHTTRSSHAISYMILQHVVLQSHWTDKIQYISSYTRPVAKKHGRVVIYREGPPPITSHNLLIMRSHDKLETLYLHYHNAYGHKTYQSGDPSTRWSCKVTWQIELYLHLLYLFFPLYLLGNFSVRYFPKFLQQRRWRNNKEKILFGPFEKSLVGLCMCDFSGTTQKQTPRGVLKKRCSENMQEIYSRTPLPKGVLQ